MTAMWDAPGLLLVVFALFARGEECSTHYSTDVGFGGAIASYAPPLLAAEAISQEQWRAATLPRASDKCSTYCSMDTGWDGALASYGPPPYAQAMSEEQRQLRVATLRRA